MDNSYYIWSDDISGIEIERFHICTWEFSNQTSLIEFGCEIVNNESIKDKSQITLSIYIPWFNDKCTVSDYYNKLKDTSNSRFIFNDSVDSTTNFDGGENIKGIIHHFRGKDSLCILPVVLKTCDKKITVTLDISGDKDKINSSNFYFRIAIAPNFKHLSLRKIGVNKLKVIYDIKLNEKRNLPSDVIIKNECKIRSSFCFNILPNNFSFDFYDSSSLKSVRTLEYDKFNRYLKDNRVKNDELIVLFNKKNNMGSYTFFSIFSKEIIGTGDLAIALILNLISGLLLFLPSLRNDGIDHKWNNLPLEVYVVLFIWAIAISYLIFKNRISSLFK